MEVSQGFSLGINSEFYPKVTSRECTVMQGLADARIAPSKLAKTYMAIRTYPIRVGDVVEVDDDDFEVPPGTLRGALRELITGAYKLDGGLLLALDTERALAFSSGERT